MFQTHFLGQQFFGMLTVWKCVSLGMVGCCILLRDTDLKEEEQSPEVAAAALLVFSSLFFFICAAFFRFSAAASFITLAFRFCKKKKISKSKSVRRDHHNNHRCIANSKKDRLGFIMLIHMLTVVTRITVW